MDAQLTSNLVLIPSLSGLVVVWLFDYLFITLELILFVKYYHKAMGSFTLSEIPEVTFCGGQICWVMRSATPTGGEARVEGMQVPSGES